MNKPADVKALLSFALSLATPLKEKIKVTVTAIKRINWLNKMIGVITPKSPDAADILIVSSPVPNTMKRNIIPRTPRAIHPIFVIF
jgi:Ni,Fe-hydrogenase III small subunit